MTLGYIYLILKYNCKYNQVRSLLKKNENFKKKNIGFLGNIGY